MNSDELRRRVQWMEESERTAPNEYRAGRASAFAQVLDIMNELEEKHAIDLEDDQ